MSQSTYTPQEAIEIVLQTKTIQNLDCPMCNALQAFFIYPGDGAIGFCMAEHLFWTIKLNPELQVKIEEKAESNAMLYFNTIKAAQEVLAYYLVPDSELLEDEAINRLLGILDDQRLVEIMKANNLPFDDLIKPQENNAKLRLGFINQLGDEILVEQYEQPISVSKAKAIHHAHYINTRKDMRTYFLLSGEANCGITCTECTPDAHHWVYTSDDVYECKHCDAWRTLTNKDEVE